MLNCKDSNTKYKPIDIRRNPYKSFDYEDLVEILGMLSEYHSFLILFSVEILGMFKY